MLPARYDDDDEVSNQQLLPVYLLIEYDLLTEIRIDNLLRYLTSNFYRYIS